MTDLTGRVEQTIFRRRLLRRGQAVLVAVSGGVDSMVLLRALHRLASRHGWRLTVAHFNHQLRGRSSDADENLVRRAAAGLGLPIVVGRAEVKSFAQKSKLSIEMAARKLRHEFLARTARARRIPAIALAHHAGDQVELFFLRILRGTGSDGLAGMKWQSPSPADAAVALVRPLLDFEKADLAGFAQQNRIRFREDASNDFVDFLRNRIRHELLPLLRKKYQPGLNRVVLRLMEILGAESEWVAEAARQWRGGRSRGFDTLPAAIQRRVLQRQLAGLGPVPDFELVEQLRCAPDCPVSVATGVAAIRDRLGRVTLRSSARTEFNAGRRVVDLSGGAGRVEFGNKRFRWQIRVGKKRVQFGPRSVRGNGLAREVFDADRVGDRVTLRHWQPGDRFRPIGMKSPVKLQDLFTNRKITAARRRELVVAAAATGEIFWVENLRIGEPFKLTSRTKRQFVWQWRPSATRGGEAGRNAELTVS